MPPQAKVAELVLVTERRIAELFPAGGAGRMEASGVLANEQGFLVIFDDSRNIGGVGADLADPAGNVVITPSGAADSPAWDGYEDIARDPLTGEDHLLVEVAEHADGEWMAKVERVDAGFTRISASWLPFRLPDAGKGMEGLTCVVRDGVTYLPAICEGNRCEGGTAGRRPGGGRIQVFTRSLSRQAAIGAHLRTARLKPSRVKATAGTQRSVSCLSYVASSTSSTASGALGSTSCRSKVASSRS